MVSGRDETGTPKRGLLLCSPSLGICVRRLKTPGVEIRDGSSASQRPGTQHARCSVESVEVTHAQEISLGAVQEISPQPTFLARKTLSASSALDGSPKLLENMWSAVRPGSRLPKCEPEELTG